MTEPESPSDAPPTAGLSAISSVFVPPAPDWSPLNPRMAAIYEKGKLQQWNATTHLDWDTPCDPEAPLPAESYFALASFDGSPLGKYGRATWTRFRQEFQSWMVSQFLPGEQAALVAAARLVEAVPDQDARLCLAVQVADEARHIEVFARYLRERVPEPYAVSPSLESLLRNILDDRRWDMTVLGMHIMVEALAMAILRLADGTFHDGLIRQICRLVAQDEARHVSLGVVSLQSLYAEMTRAERQDREDFVLEAVNLVSRRFLFEEIWERLGIRRDEGVHFARTNELMVKYRQAICARIVTSLAHIHLMTDRLRDRFERLDLLGLHGLHAVAAGHRHEGKGI